VLVATLAAVTIGARLTVTTRLALLTMIVACIAAAWSYGPLRVRFERWASPGSAGADLAPLGQTERFGLTSLVLRDIADHWLAGVPTAQARRGLRVVSPDGTGRTAAGSYCSHLNWAWHYGVPAALGSLGLMIAGTVAGMRSTKPTVVAAAAGCLAWLLHSLVTDIWQHPLLMAAHHTIALLLWIEFCESRRERRDARMGHESVPANSSAPG
jgi:hypothetical protein